MTDELITKLLEASFSDRVNVALTLSHSSLRELGKDVQQVVDPERKRGPYTGEQMRKVIYGNISKAQIIEDSSKLLEKFWGSNVYDLQIKAMRKEKYDF